MSEKDFSRFIQKIRNLNDLVNSLDKHPGRKEKLISCITHQEVVNLARSWGYEIGRQWGDLNDNHVD